MSIAPVNQRQIRPLPAEPHPTERTSSSPFRIEVFLFRRAFAAAPE